MYALAQRIEAYLVSVVPAHLWVHA